jgi:ABC-type branched-subunit amino acid transport system substrate-binding protein
MMKSRIRRYVAVMSASAMALGVGIFSSGLGAASAGASGSVPGVTSTSITIGATVPLSGIAASYAEVSAAANAVFKYVNAHGKVNGRTINYIRLDDCYNLASSGLGCTQSTSTTTLSQTKVLVETDHVFATVGSLGTAAQDTVLSYLKTNKVPQLFVNSGSSDWNQPSKYPNLFGFQTSYETENQIFASVIEKSYKTDKVGFVGQNDDFGANGYLGLTSKTGVSVASTDKFLYNPVDAVIDTADINTPLAKMQSDGVQLVVVDAVPPVTKLILAKAHNLGFNPVWLISTVGSNPISVDSTYEVGATSTDSFPPTDASGASNVWNVWLRKVLAADPTDFPGYSSSQPLDGNEQYGASFAVAFVEALKGLGKNVTQAGIEKAMTTTKFALPTVCPLVYTSKNHQGLDCTVLSTIPANGTGAPIYVSEPSKTVYVASGVAGSKVTTTTEKISSIPNWLK